MLLALSLHHVIENHNVLQTPTERIESYFENHPDFYKIVLLVNHVFRAVAMAAFCLVLPFSAPINVGICFAASLLYRLTVETHCPYKFSLPAFAGSAACLTGAPAFANLVNGVAFHSLHALASAFLSLLPLTAWAAYIVLTVDYDVDHPMSCCF